jgi:ketosteroid isomerase-like protein
MLKEQNMLSENMNLVTRIYKAFENRNSATFFSLLSHEIHVTQCPQVPWGGVFQGIDEAKLFFERVNTYLDSHVTIERIINGGDRIAVIGRTHGAIKDTGGAFDVPIMHLWAFKDGLAGRLEIVIDVPVMQVALWDSTVHDRTHSAVGQTEQRNQT